MTLALGVDIGGSRLRVALVMSSGHIIARAETATAAEAGPEAVEAVPTSAFPTPARRPHNSRLDTRKLREAFGLALPDWRVGVERMLREVLDR